MSTTEYTMESFSPGCEVIYDNQFIGSIRFVCEDYLTLCVSPTSPKHSEVCICIPQERWNRICFTRHSTK